MVTPSECVISEGFDHPHLSFLHLPGSNCDTLTSGCQGHAFNQSAALPGPLTQPLQVLQPALCHTLLILEVQKLLTQKLLTQKLLSPLMTQGCVEASW